MYLDTTYSRLASQRGITTIVFKSEVLNFTRHTCKMNCCQILAANNYLLTSNSFNKHIPIYNHIFLVSARDNLNRIAVHSHVDSLHNTAIYAANVVYFGQYITPAVSLTHI